MNKGKHILIDKNLLEKNDDLKQVLKRGINAAESINGLNEQDKNKVANFLASPEVEMTIRQIISLNLSEETSKNVGLANIRKEFIALFSFFNGTKDSNFEDLGNHLLDAIIDGCCKSLDIMMDKGILSGHEAKSVFRYRSLLDEITNIEKNLALLCSLNQQKLDIQTIIDFETKYRRQVVHRHGTITPPNFDRAIKIPINDLYVRPNFNRISNMKDEDYRSLRMEDLLLSANRIVILGTPGGGKSTFANKLCYDLATNYLDRLFANRLITPILITLRDYGSQKKEQLCSIFQFIESTINSRYQIQPLNGVIEYMLLNGRLLVIFDGLDELLDTSYRQEISNDIESFCILYPSVPIIVTSREIGYEQAPLDKIIFEVFRLSPFNEDQVKQYANNWFNIDTDLTFEQRNWKIESFLEESEIVADIRSNPLMLALMCNIYRGENYIPKNRPDIYEKCAIMLFDRWDKSRNIKALQKIEELEAHIKPMMMYLAHWIYTHGSLQSGVTEKILVTKAADYLFGKRFEDRDEAENAASKFIEFCKGRAWVFTDIGTTKDGESLYQFTHRTFLEYFTAAHLVRINPIPEKLEVFLLPRILNQEGDMVAQLSVQIINKNVEGAADQLFMAFIQKSEGNYKGTWNSLSFIARCLEFIVPSPKVTRCVTELYIDKWIEWGLTELKSREKKVVNLVPSQNSAKILTYLLSASFENRKIIMDSIDKKFIKFIEDGSVKEKQLILEILSNVLTFLRIQNSRKKKSIEVPESWKMMETRLLSSYYEKFFKLSRNNNNICQDLLHLDRITIEHLIKYHGLKSLFSKRYLFMSPNSTRPPIIDQLIEFLKNYPYLKSNQEALIESRLHMLQGIGIYFLENTPVLTPEILLDTKSIGKDTDFLIEYRHFYPRSYNESTNTGHFKKKKVIRSSDALLESPKVLFGIFILFALIFERYEKEFKKDEMTEDILKLIYNEFIFFGSIEKLLNARLGVINIDSAKNEMGKLCFERKQIMFITDWISRDINILS